MKRCFLLLAALGAACLAAGSQAQGTRADYERAAGLGRRYQGRVVRDRITPRWLDAHRFWYRVDLGPGRSETWLVDAATGKKSPYTPPPGAGGGELEPRSVFGLRSREGGAETELTFENRTGGPVQIFWIEADGSRRDYGMIPAGGMKTQHTFAGHAWLVVDGAGRPLAGFVAETTPGKAIVTGEARTPRRGGGRTARTASPTSPDGKWTAFLKERNLWLRETATGQERRLTTDGAEARFLDGPLLWSPDSNRLLAWRTIPAEEHKVHIVESSPADQVQPKLRTLDYLKPGDRVRVSKPALFTTASGGETAVADTLFDNPWSITDARWEPDSGRVTFVYNQRGHQLLRVVAVDAATGQASALVEERSATFIDYSGKFFFQRLEKSGEIVWMSERDGWNHLYLYDARSGRVKTQVTRGEWVVRGVDRIDEEKREVWFRAGGMDPEQDPYHVHYCRVKLDGTGLVRLTAGDGTHAVQYSPDRKFLIDTYSRVDLPPVTELRRTDDGSLVTVLERGDASALAAEGWKAPERFTARARDGRTDIYGLIFRPTNFDPARRYPVIEDIYAGPQDSFVPKAFRPLHSQQTLAELGFIVVKIDGMGTSNRSKAFHDVCHRNLGDAGLPDRILWMKAAAAKYPYMDLERVGVFGGSAGGQNALRALLAHPEFYKVGVAACGCHDNRMDKIWWNELWMGWPVGPHYAEQSNVTQAHRLQGKLLLIVGEVDTNVDPASTMQVVNALIRADKDFDLLVVPGAGHGMGGSYGMRRLQDFFVRNLLHAEPRRERP